MKKIVLLLVAAMVAGLVTGCGSSSFQPDQTGISIQTNGSIVSVIKESLDKSYYDQTELENMIHETVDAYNESAGGDWVEVKQYTVENGMATLEMTYDSVTDYRNLNQMKLYTGDLTGTQNTEYQLEGTFFEVDGGKLTGQTTDAATILSGENYNVVVLEEEILVEVPGDIVFISDDVQLMGEREAKAGESTQAAETEQQETNASGIPVISPEGTAETDTTETQQQESGNLFYIIYE